MTRFAPSRRLRLLAASFILGGSVVSGGLAVAQSPSPPKSFASLPSFAWPQSVEGEDSRWTGSYARLATGFEVASSKRFGGYAGPTLGFEGGRMWRQGDLVYGIVGGFDYLAAIGGGTTPRFGGLAYSRDFAAALQVKVGTLLTPDVLLYAKAGAAAVHETLRFGPSAASLPVTREDIAVGPDARVGVEWAVTDRLSVAVEAGVSRRATPW